MTKKKKIFEEEYIPEFEESIATIAEDSKIFVEKSLEIANYLMQLLAEKDLKQKDLADKLGKSEAEVSKWLTGMHNFTLRSLSKLEAALGATIICTPRQLTERPIKMTKEIKTGSFNAKVFARPAICTPFTSLKVAYKAGEEQIIWENSKAV